jgi:hypothetical protein
MALPNFFLTLRFLSGIVFVILSFPAEHKPDFLGLSSLRKWGSKRKTSSTLADDKPEHTWNLATFWILASHSILNALL